MTSIESAGPVWRCCCLLGMGDVQMVMVTATVLPGFRFPKKPAKKMAYIAGLPKPHGCV